MVHSHNETLCNSKNYGAIMMQNNMNESLEK